jgi:group I intron endonuclease
MVIYITTNLITQEKYIGKDRNNSPSYLGGGVLLKEAIQKYGRENFKKEILEVCKNLDELKEKECYWLEYYHASNNPLFYNLTNKSFGSDRGPTKTEKYLKRGKKISEGRKGNHYPEASKSQQGLKKIKVSKALKGKPKTEEHKKNLSKSKQQWFQNNPNPRKGKPDLKQKGKPKPGAGGKGKPKPGAGPKSGKYILDIETGEVFKSVKEVLEKFGYHKRKMYLLFKDPNSRFKYFINN